ncbi:Hypothetical protein CINCED_3A016261 [Cinara cedri]|nr:Hypothetical protein CINCED_3A016261 [Cinara cedri]
MQNYVVLMKDPKSGSELGYVVSEHNNLAVIAVPVKGSGKIITKFFVVPAKMALKAIKAAAHVLSPRKLKRKFDNMRMKFHAVHVSHETKNHVRTITVDGRGVHWTKLRKLVPTPPSASRTVIGKMMNSLKFTKDGVPPPHGPPFGNPAGPPFGNPAGPPSGNPVGPSDGNPVFGYPGEPVQVVKKKSFLKDNPISKMCRNYKAKRQFKKQQRQIKRDQLGQK